MFFLSTADSNYPKQLWTDFDIILQSFGAQGLKLS